MYPTPIQQSIVVIYHAGCLDGIAAAYAAYVKFGHSAEYIPFNYRMVPNLAVLKGKEIYVVDFSFKRDVYLELLEVADSVTVLDHHKTAHEEIGDLVTIDQSKSGAVLAWEYFHPESPLPELFLLVQDRDLWQWQYATTDAFTSYMFLKPLTLENFEAAMTTPLTDMISKGQVILDYNNNELARASKSIRSINLLGYIIPVANVPASLTSKLGNQMALGKPFSLSYSDNRDVRSFSLRSTDEGLDVSTIAKVYGGGGHRNAAAFSLPLDSPLLDNFLYEIKAPVEFLVYYSHRNAVGDGFNGTELDWNWFQIQFYLTNTLTDPIEVRAALQSKIKSTPNNLL